MNWRNLKDMTRDEVIAWLRGPNGKAMSQEAAEILADQMQPPTTQQEAK